MDLHVASFKSTVLTDADLSVANLTNAYLGNATLTGADFTGADLPMLFDGCHADRRRLHGAEVRGASFSLHHRFRLHRRAALLDRQLPGGRPRGDRPRDNDLTGWDFAGQNLTDASFGWCHADRRRLHRCGGPRGHVFLDHRFRFHCRAALLDRQLPGGRPLGHWPRGNDLTGWNFAGQNLTDASFSDATLTDADLSARAISQALISALRTLPPVPR